MSHILFSESQPTDEAAVAEVMKSARENGLVEKVERYCARHTMPSPTTTRGFLEILTAVTREQVEYVKRIDYINPVIEYQAWIHTALHLRHVALLTRAIGGPHPICVMTTFVPES